MITLTSVLTKDPQEMAEDRAKKFREAIMGKPEKNELLPKENKQNPFYKNQIPTLKTSLLDVKK